MSNSSSFPLSAHLLPVLCPELKLKRLMVTELWVVEWYLNILIVRSDPAWPAEYAVCG